MPLFALTYEVVEDYAEKRTEYREEHLSIARLAYDRGDLVLAGALGDPIDGALLVFRGPDESVAEQFARNDPYVLNGLVTSWQVKPWHVVVGEVAE